MRRPSTEQEKWPCVLFFHSFSFRNGNFSSSCRVIKSGHAVVFIVNLGLVTVKLDTETACKTPGV